LKKAATLFCTLAIAFSPLAARALQESTITDEPSVSKPQNTMNSGPAQPAQASPPPATSTPAPASPPPPASAGKDAQTVPAGKAAQPAGPSPSSPPTYQPSGQNKSASGGSWTPGAAGQPAQEETAPSTSGGSGRIFDMPDAKKVQVSTYSRKEVDDQVMGFFEGGARGLADLVSRAFDKYGEPTGFIKGNEGAGALVVGLRYGEGWLYLKNGKKAYVYWQSPSVGFDLGVNASKVFCLVYGVTDPEQIYQRFPSVDGSAYVVGGFGMNFQQSGPVVLGPIRFGVGLRLGANVGYMDFTRDRTINPF
jgi:hypothetical protein